MEPFERDKLYISIVSALGHRRDAVTISKAITATVIAKLLKTAQGACVNREMICMVVISTLKSFDTPAAVQYEAYHDNKPT